MIKLTYEEREQEQVWCLMPYDVSNEEFQLRQTVKKEVNNKRRIQRFREEERERREKMQNTPSREDAILAMLSSSRDWTPISVLVKQAETCKAFRRPDGKQVGRSWDYPRRERFGSMGLNVSPGFSGSLRKVVHRAVTRLEECGEVETELRGGVRGMVRFVRTRVALKLIVGGENDGSVTGFVTVTR